MTCADGHKFILHSPCIGDCSRCRVRNRAIIYGPVRSRRRGLSLGVNFYPLYKVCSFDCVYCIRGRTVVKTFIPDVPLQVSPKQITKFLEIVLAKTRADTVDLSGNGEPTLYPRLTETVRDLYRICVDYGIRSLGMFTNSTVLASRHALAALRYIDHVEAKLDVVDNWKLHLINRPAHGLTIDKLVNNIRAARKLATNLVVQILVCDTYTGAGCIRSIETHEIDKLVEILLYIDPDEVYIYTAYRPSWRAGQVRPVTASDVEHIVETLVKHGLKVRVFI